MALLLLGRKKKNEKYPPETKNYMQEIYFFLVYFMDLTLPCWSFIKKNICPGVFYKIKNKKMSLCFGGLIFVVFI